MVRFFFGLCTHFIGTKLAKTKNINHVKGQKRSLTTPPGFRSQFRARSSCSYLCVFVLLSNKRETSQLRQDS